MPYHHQSEFGPGRRVPLDRERRAVWRARVDLARRAGRITADHALVALALLRRLGQDGRLDPSHDTLAADIGVSARTVRRALVRLASCGLVAWVRRLVRVPGWRVAQISNAYELKGGEAFLFGCGGQVGRGTNPLIFNRKMASERSATGWEAQKAEAARQLRALGMPVPDAWGAC